jgi:hypothetical protein
VSKSRVAPYCFTNAVDIFVEAIIFSLVNRLN